MMIQRANTLPASNNRNEAIDIIFSFRQQLGLPILKNKPASPLIIVKEFIKTKNALGKRTAEDIASLPDLTDDRIIMGQRMLELACTSSFQVRVRVWFNFCLCQAPSHMSGFLFKGSTYHVSSHCVPLGESHSQIWHQCKFL